MEELQPVHFPLHPARRILNDTEQLKYSMLKYSSLQTGTLKLGMLWIGGYLNLPQLITDYHDRHPLVTCHLDVEGSKTLFHILKARDLHAIFIIGSEKQLRNQSDIAIQLASNNLAIGFSSNSIAVRLKNPGCKIVPLEVTLSRPIYYVTHKDMLNYPTIHSFTDFIKDRFQPDKPIP